MCNALICSLEQVDQWSSVFHVWCHMVYVSHDKTLRNQGSWSLAGIWNHSWSATACDMRDRSNVFACLQDLFLTGAADELLTAFLASMRPALCQSRVPDDTGGWLCLYSQDSWHSCEWAAGTSSPAEGMAERSDLLSPWDQVHEKHGLPSLPLSSHMNSTVSSGLRTNLNCQVKCYSWAGNMLHHWSCICAPNSAVTWLIQIARDE